MKLITSLTDSAKQTVTLILDDGSRVPMSFTYVPTQQGWFYTFTYGTFTVNNKRLVNSPNLLRAYREFLPFGFACTVIDGFEPVYQTDFISGRVSFYLLNSTDVAEVEQLITITLPNFNGYPLI